MNKRAGINFLAGLVISYTIAVLVITLEVIITGGKSVPVYILLEGFGLAVCTSLIGAVFSSDRLSFLLQAVLTYIFAFAVILIFCFMFKWYDTDAGGLNGISFFVTIIGLFTTMYIIIILIRMVFQKKSTKLMNAKLTEYKKNKKKGKQEE